MYVVRENESLVNAKKSFVTSMSVIKQIEREKRKETRNKKTTTTNRKKKNNRKHVSKNLRS